MKITKTNISAIKIILEVDGKPETNIEFRKPETILEIINTEPLFKDLVTKESGIKYDIKEYYKLEK